VISPSHVRRLTGIARRPYIPRKAIENDELELVPTG
jgi:hypothetical protein